MKRINLRIAPDSLECLIKRVPAAAPILAAAPMLCLLACAEKGVAPEPDPEPRVVLNELMADNAGTTADDDGEFDDWIEILNVGETEIPLSDLALTDRLDDTDPWIPEGTEALSPGERVLIWADGDDTALHADFKLNVLGETVVLHWSREGGIIDSVTYEALDADEAYARFPDGEGPWRRTDQPTPGGSNS
ncbi:MAG: hypothetical protein CME06_02990 [Gemmatimonadetes bacterium]|nr:hypothetical protein [Gemmatimonadota bacterium]